MIRCRTGSAAETAAVGARIAEFVRSGDVVLLLGDLGSGKTTLVVGLAGALGAPDPVTSPTFALCHLYASNPPLAHVDCWRLAGAEELDDLALEELLDEDHAAVLEWGELARERLGDEALVVTLGLADGGDGREITIEANGSSWGERLADLAARFEAPRAKIDRR